MPYVFSTASSTSSTVLPLGTVTVFVTTVSANVPLLVVSKLRVSIFTVTLILFATSANALALIANTITSASITASTLLFINFFMFSSFSAAFYAALK